MASNWDSADAYREQGVTLWDAASGRITTVCDGCEPDDYCDCHDFATEWWDTVLRDLVRDNPWDYRHDWQVRGLPLWNGDAHGVVTVKTPADLLRAVTVNADYRLDWELTDDTTLSLTLYHHDVPTGRSFTAHLVWEADAE